MLFYADYLLVTSAIMFYVAGYWTFFNMSAVFGITYLLIGTGAFAFFGFRIWTHFKIVARMKKAKENGEEFVSEYSNRQRKEMIAAKMEHEIPLSEEERKLAERFALTSNDNKKAEEEKKHPEKEETKKPPTDEDLFGL